MNACIVSYYMPNINPKTVDLQKKVVEKFNITKLPHIVMKGEIPHGMFIDYCWALNGVSVKTIDASKVQKQLDFDYVIILDIDCVPVSQNGFNYFLSKANEGKIVGNMQRSGHIKNGDHLFAAPSCTAISRENFIKIGSPSALETQRGDVLEEYTFEAEKVGVPVELIPPSKFDRPPFRYDWEEEKMPYWELKNGQPNYGLGTTYGNQEAGDLFWHNFQIRVPGQEEHFWKKCEDLLNG